MKAMTKMALAAAALALAVPAAAMGLRTQFGEVVIKNVYIGETYSLDALLNMPMRVTNTGEEPVDLVMEVVPPTSNRKDGYEVLPSTSWIKLDKGLHLGVAPGAEAVSDVVFTIPDEPKHLGARYQAVIWSHTVNRAGLAAGLASNVLLNIASQPPGEEEKLRAKVKKRLANLNFSLMPNFGTVEEFPLGRKVDLKKEHKVSLKLVNPNDEKVTFHLVPKSPLEASITVVKGYELPPNPRHLKVEPEVLEVEANSIGEANLFLEIPDYEQYRGASWMFVVSADLLEQEIPVHFNYRLLVTAAKKLSDKKPSEAK